MGVTGANVAMPAQVNYWPSQVEKTAEVEAEKYAKTHISKEQISGVRVKEDLYVGDDYKQAGDRIRSMDPDRHCSSSPRLCCPLAVLRVWRRAFFAVQECCASLLILL
jgi:hypothetical protein